MYGHTGKYTHTTADIICYAIEDDTINYFECHDQDNQGKYICEKEGNKGEEVQVQVNLFIKEN